jgi:hypothetical protein
MSSPPLVLHRRLTRPENGVLGLRVEGPCNHHGLYCTDPAPWPDAA